MFNQHKETDVVIGMVMSEAHLDPAPLIHKIAAGMEEYFPQYSWTFVHASAGKPPQQNDVTNGVVRNLVSIQVPRFGVHRVTYPWHGVPAKTNGIRAILEIAQCTSAKVCLLADPAQLSFESLWIDALVRPGIHSRYDLVTPVYSSSSRERLMSRNLLSPMFQALLGQGPKEPMAGELLLSASLINRLLARHDWDSEPARYAPELWIAFIAAAEGYRMAESAVGPSARQAQASKVSRQVAIGQILGSFFTLMEQYENRWSSRVSGSALDRFGQPTPTVREPANGEGLGLEACFVDAFPALQDLWRSILDPHTFTEIAAFRSSLRNGDDSKPLGEAVWVRIVYEIAAAWKRRVLPRSQVLGLFTPLLLARIGSFLVETQWKEQAEVEAELSRLGNYFEALRPALQRLWFADTAADQNNRTKVIHHAEAA